MSPVFSDCPCGARVLRPNDPCKKLPALAFGASPLSNGGVFPHDNAGCGSYRKYIRSQCFLQNEVCGPLPSKKNAKKCPETIRIPNSLPFFARNNSGDFPSDPFRPPSRSRLYIQKPLKSAWDYLFAFFPPFLFLACPGAFPGLFPAGESSEASKQAFYPCVP